MVQKILILYDLKEKSDVERTQIQRKLYGYRDKSNYKYNYDREGLLNNVDHEKTRKTVLRVKNKKDLTKVTELLKKLKIEFELVRK
jgi:hypothetical protein|tara:strand:+ start:1086 stop:1343 length:258 start_codon:yes stop_codon:yes gene_type:complete